MTRERLAASMVFTPTDFPHHTYVPRNDLHHERLLREWARTSTQIASVSGPSKAGKTVLVAAHGNSLRALVMAIEGLTPDEILKREIATGQPTVYRIGPDGKLVQRVEL